MAGKFAMTWTTSRNYMPGTNASLNAMEFYGWEGVDVFVLTGGQFLDEKYRAAWDCVDFIDLNALVPKGKNQGWNFRYADIIHALGLFRRGYDVVLLWGGDLCIVDDFTEYFDISDKLGAMVLGTNEHGSHCLERLSAAWPYAHTWSVPYADVPFFVPKKWASVLELMLDYTRREGCELSRMDGLNYAVRDTKARVHAVPGELWVVNVPYRWRLSPGNSKILYVFESSTRLRSFHRKYWNATICRQYLPGSGEPYQSISRKNKLLFNQFYNFFNRECRVPWTEGLEVWDGK